jgi:hypothetical protein
LFSFVLDPDPETSKSARVEIYPFACSFLAAAIESIEAKTVNALHLIVTPSIETKNGSSCGLDHFISTAVRFENEATVKSLKTILEPGSLDYIINFCSGSNDKVRFFAE